MPYEIFYRTTEGAIRFGLTEDEVREAIQNREGLIWVDVSLTSEEDGLFLQRVFGFHHLTIEDCVSPTWAATMWSPTTTSTSTAPRP